MNRATGLLLIALLLAAVFFLSLPGTTAWQRVLQDAGHGPVFAGIAVVVLLMLRQKIGDIPLFLQAFLITLAIGIASEVVQYLQPNRNVSIFDVIHDAAGAALGLALFALYERHKRGAPTNQPSPSSAWLVALVLGSLILLLWTPLRCATAYAERHRAFPSLVQASHYLSGYFVRGRDADLTVTKLPEKWQREGEGDDSALRLSFPRQTQPALELDEPAPDWRGYDTLNLDVTNPAPEPLQLMLRILDARHDWSHADRFNMPITIPAASRVLVQVSLVAVASAPANRPMDMAAIKNVMLFSRTPLPGTEIYVSRLWLQ